MTDDLELACRCGEVRGRLRDAVPNKVNRVVCYCDDCQAFLHHLGRADLLDEHGGTEVIQVAPAALVFERGTEKIAGVRLRPKGLYRWYAGCCKTPLGNTLTPAIPFVGIPHELFRGAPDARRRDEVFGKTRGGILDKFAIGRPPKTSPLTNARMIAGVVRLLLGWKLGGRAWPHPFFDRATGAPIRSLPTLTKEERDALRPLCGPKPVTPRPASADLSPS
jgi:hypothetical protein